MSKPAETVNEVKEVRGYCALCTAHCATIATVENGRVTKLEPDHDHPNGGVMCIKGKAAPELVYNSERLNKNRGTAHRLRCVKQGRPEILTYPSGNRVSNLRDRTWPDQYGMVSL